MHIAPSTRDRCSTWSKALRSVAIFSVRVVTAVRPPGLKKKVELVVRKASGSTGTWAEGSWSVSSMNSYRLLGKASRECTTGYNFHPVLNSVCCSTRSVSEVLRSISNSARRTRTPFQTSVSGHPTLTWFSFYCGSSRTTNWELHLSCILQMLPWRFCYDRQNSAGYTALSFGR